MTLIREDLRHMDSYENRLNELFKRGLSGIFEDERLRLDFAQSLAEGDLRPIVIKNFEDDKIEEQQ